MFSLVDSFTEHQLALQEIFNEHS